MDTKTKEIFYDKLTFIYLEMPKFTKTEAELETLFDKWLYVIRNLASLMERPRALQEKVFQHLFEAAEIAKFDKKERYEYEESLKAYRDLFSMVETAKLKGHAEGLEEGLKEGHAKGLEEGLAQGLREVERNKISTARKLKQLGLALADIVSVSGLSEEEIRQL